MNTAERVPYQHMLSGRVPFGISRFEHGWRLRIPVWAWYGLGYDALLDEVRKDFWYRCVVIRLELGSGRPALSLRSGHCVIRRVVRKVAHG